jgi:hypothetical protein
LPSFAVDTADCPPAPAAGEDEAACRKVAGNAFSTTNPLFVSAEGTAAAALAFSQQEQHGHEIQT